MYGMGGGGGGGHIWGWGVKRPTFLHTLEVFFFLDNFDWLCVCVDVCMWGIFDQCMSSCRFRISPSFSRDSQPSVVVSACLKLNAPQQALEMLTDSVKYGLFPSRRCLCKVLYSFSFSHNLEGDSNVSCIKDWCVYVCVCVCFAFMCLCVGTVWFSDLTLVCLT